MINSRLPKIFHGGDYNPDQWPRNIWEEDVRLFRLANIDIATLPVFSWARLQPDETHYQFAWLDDVIELLWKNGVYLCLATSTAAHPAWMARRYPDILRVDFEGRKRKFGGRHNSCPNSPTYRTYAPRLAAKLAERYGTHPGLLVWHVSNEFGGACYCDNCAAAFRIWLQRRYGSLAEVNDRWVTAFWGHTFYDWEEIVPPNALSESWSPERTSFQGIALDYQRFMSDSLLDSYLLERDTLKKITPDIPVTTNLMGHYKPLDYFHWAPHLDVISWDSYPPMQVEPFEIALRHDLMRGLKKGLPFMLMEQTPSQQNWQPYNSLKRPGVLRLWSYQAIAHGADAIMYFQLRRSRGACEKWHGAVIAHAGHENTRVFHEVSSLGRELNELGDATLDTRLQSHAAIVFDWENWWALEMSSGPSQDLKYLPHIYAYYGAFWRAGIPVDFIAPDFDLDQYQLVIAPLLYLLQPGFAKKAEAFVDGGGVFLTTVFSGMVDENDRAALGGYPGELRKTLGLWVEEFDALPPDLHNQLVIEEPFGKLQRSYQCSLLHGLLHLESAEPIASFGRDFYAGRPAVTRNRFGNGRAWYVATVPEKAFTDDLIATLCAEIAIESILSTPPGIEVTQRSKNGRTLTFVLNHNDEPCSVDLTSVAGTDMLTGRQATGTVELPGREVLIIRKST